MKRILSILAITIMAIISGFAQNAADSLIVKAREAEQQEDYAQAIDCFKQAQAWYEQNGFPDQKNYALCLSRIGVSYLFLKQNELSMDYSLKALAIRKDLYGEVSEDYISSLSNVALTYFQREDYSKAIEWQEKACSLMEQLPKEHPDYRHFMMNMGRFYYFGGQLQASAQAWEIALTKYEKFGEMYENLLKWLGMVYDESNDNKNMKRILALMEEHNKHELSKPCDTPDCMLGKAEYYSSQGKNNKAKETYMQVFKMEMTDALKAKAEESYAKFLFVHMEDEAGAAEYFTMAAESSKRAVGVTKKYAQLMLSAARMEFGAYKALPCIEKAEKARAFYADRQDDDAKKELAGIHTVIGNAYSMERDYKQCLLHYNKALEYQQGLDRDTKEVAYISTKIAFVCRRLKEYEAAIVADERALAIYSKINDADNYKAVATDLGLCYTLAGRPQEVSIDSVWVNQQRDAMLDKEIQSQKNLLSLMKEYMNSLDYAQSFGTLAGMYYLKQDHINSLQYYQQFMDLLFVGIREQFRMFDASDRLNIWKNLKSDLNELGELSYEYPSSDQEGIQQLSGLLYDAQLLSKGILLNSSIAFSRVLKESGNQELLALYEQIRSSEIKLQEMRANANKEEELRDILTLQQEVTAQQVKLYDGCAEFADYTEYMSYRWHDVQKKLRPNDVAIEFAVLKDPKKSLPGDQTMFALVIDAQCTHPARIAIGKIDDLKHILSDQDCYSNPLAGSFVWGQLQTVLNGKERIFFSADALFNSIGIEYLQVNGKPLSEQYDVYRLSSTKELCYSRPQHSLDHIVMMGDIDYGKMAENIDEGQLKQLMTMRSMRESASAFVQLPYTEKEINAIASIYSKKNPLVFKKQEATEQAFRNLNDKRINLLHISTHGAYIEDEATTDAESMQQCLLALSGANQGSNDMENDGIINAADISNLNLRECELAVLSACQTGLGRQGDDGVFGLQRGFKNAGVRSLLITLSSVYDESTAMLMEQFHQNLSANPKDKRAALVKAQQYLRSHGFEDPRYWATFILLDATL